MLHKQVKAWLVLLAIAVLALWLFRGILLPFVVGMALAYLLDPVADQLERWHFSRLMATILILIVTILLFLGALLLLVPLLIQQFLDLAAGLPDYASRLQDAANALAPKIYELLGHDQAVQLQNSMSTYLADGFAIMGNITGQIMQSGLALLNAVGILIVTPVVAFYLLLDWDRMVATLNGLLPLQYRHDIRKVFHDIDEAMSGVIRGQGGVMMILALFYAATLTAAGLNFGLAIGLTTGLLSFIPYVGFFIGFVLSMGVAFVQFQPDWFMVGIIFVIFVVGQFLEGNVLYPKMVGSSIGVHPVWLMFALFAIGLLFGFVGVLLAVPIAAIGGVLTRFAVGKYKASILYLGEAEDDPKALAAHNRPAPLDPNDENAPIAD